MNVQILTLSKRKSKCIRAIQHSQLDLIKRKECRDKFDYFLNLGSIKYLKKIELVVLIDRG